MISDLLKNSSNSCRIFVVSDYIVQALSMVHSLHKKLPFGCSQGHELKNKMQYLDPIYLLWTTCNHKCWNTYEQSSQTRCCFLKRFKNLLFKSTSWPTRHTWVHLKRNKNLLQWLHILKYIYIIIKIQSYLITNGFLIKYISRTKAELCSIVHRLGYSI